VANIYSIGSCFWALLVGVFIRWTGRFKYLALVFGVPLTILGTGLMIHFRQPDQNVGYLIMCQIFIAFAGGTLVICEQMAVMAAASHQQVAVVLAIEGMFSSVGGAVGSTIAAAIWTGNSYSRRQRINQRLTESQAFSQRNLQIFFPPARNRISSRYTKISSPSSHTPRGRQRETQSSAPTELLKWICSLRPCRSSRLLSWRSQCGETIT
jgi:hypothetical protein